MQRQIERLPSWSAESKQQYHEFFANYGTHVVTRLALGGILRVIVESTDEVITKHNSTVSGDELAVTSFGRSTRTRNVIILRDGGGSVAAELTSALEDHFTHPESSSNRQDISLEWVKHLEKDPVFCPDDPITQYQLLYTLDGLTDSQRNALRLACESYLASGQHKLEVSRDGGEVSPDRGESNLRSNAPWHDNRRLIFKKLMHHLLRVFQKIIQGKASSGTLGTV
jgi:hypothetical protein